MCNLDNILEIASKKLCQSTTILVWITNDTFFKVHYHYEDSPEYNPLNHRIFIFCSPYFKTILLKIKRSSYDIFCLVMLLIFKKHLHSLIYTIVVNDYFQKSSELRVNIKKSR